MAFDCVGGSTVEGAVDMELVVLELPAVDYDVGCQKSGFDVFCESTKLIPKQGRDVTGREITW